MISFGVHALVKGFIQDILFGGQNFKHIRISLKGGARITLILLFASLFY